MVVSLEVEEDRAFSEALISQLTGGDRVSARGMYQKDSLEFLPVFALWFAANRRPKVPDGASPLWRRLLQIPFMEKLPEAEQDPTVKKRLSDPAISGSAVLNWLLEGCFEYQSEGLNPPEGVRSLTEEYRRESDPLAGFIEDRCMFGPGIEVPKGKLYRAYLEWYEVNGGAKRDRLTKTKFGRLLPEQYDVDSYRRPTGNRARMWLGIGLKKDRDN
jgi:putative DNA primase/helicase